MIFFEIIEYESIGSTNEEMKSLLKNGWMHEGMCIWTPRQLQGKGQRGNSWQSVPDKDLTFSILLKPPVHKKLSAFSILQMMSLAVVNYLERRIDGNDVLIKWPNDILVGRKKICGVLIENSISGGEVTSIVGVGLNVQSSLSDRQDLKATSIRQESGKLYSVRAELDELLGEVSKQYTRMLGNPREVLEAYQGLIYGKGKTLRFVENGSDEFQAVIKEVDSDGRLVLDRNGIEKAYLHGQIKIQY